MKNKRNLFIAFVLTLCCGVMVLAGCSKNVKPTLKLIDEFKTTYYVSKDLDVTDGTLEYKNKKGKKEPITITVDMVEGFDSTSVGNKTLTITYENLEITVDYVVKYRPALTVVSPFKTTYYVGESLDLTGGTVKYKNEDGEENTVDVTSGMVEGFNSETAGNKTLTITYQGVTISVDYVVKYHASLKVIVPFKTEYSLNETLNVENGVICYTDEDGNSQYVEIRSEMISNFNTSTDGDKTLILTYEGINIYLDYSVVEIYDVDFDKYYYRDTTNGVYYGFFKFKNVGNKYYLYTESVKWSEIPSLEYEMGFNDPITLTRSVVGGKVKYTYGSGDSAIEIIVLDRYNFSYKLGSNTAVTYREFANYNENSFYYTYDIENAEFTYLKVERLELSNRVQVYLADSVNAPSSEMNNLNSYTDNAEFIRSINDDNVVEYYYTVNSTLTNIISFENENTVHFYKEINGERTLYLTYTLFN